MALAFRSNSFSKANSSLTTVVLTGSSSTLCLYDTDSLTHTVSLSHTHCLTLSHTLSLSLTHCRTLCLTLSRAGSSSSFYVYHSLTVSLSLSPTLFLTHRHSLSHTHGRFFFLLFRCTITAQILPWKIFHLPLQRGKFTPATLETD